MTIHWLETIRCLNGGWLSVDSNALCNWLMVQDWQIDVHLLLLHLPCNSCCPTQVKQKGIKLIVSWPLAHDQPMLIIQNASLWCLQPFQFGSSARHWINCDWGFKHYSHCCLLWHALCWHMRAFIPTGSSKGALISTISWNTSSSETVSFQVQSTRMQSMIHPLD